MKVWSRLFRRYVSTRPDRVKVKFFHDIIIIINDKEYEVHNISTGGLGLMVNKDDKFPKGEKINAVAKIYDKLCDIELEFVHRTGNILGCKVITACDVFREYVTEYFHSELAALSLSKIDEEKLRENEHGQAHWFYGDVNHELHYTTKDDKVTTFQINYQGYVAVQNEDGNIYCGLLLEEDREGGHKTANLVSEDVELTEEMKISCYVLLILS
jgi:hypothetical protein